MSNQIAVLTLNIGHLYKKCTGYGTASKIIWCTQHDYTFINEESVYDKNDDPIRDENGNPIFRPIPWYKLKLISKYLPAYDYILWLDGDTILLNMTYTVDDFIPFFSIGKSIPVGHLPAPPRREVDRNERALLANIPYLHLYTYKFYLE